MQHRSTALPVSYWALVGMLSINLDELVGFCLTLERVSDIKLKFLVSTMLPADQFDTIVPKPGTLLYKYTQ